MGLLLVFPGLTLLLFLYLVSIIGLLCFSCMSGKVIPNSKIEEYEYMGDSMGLIGKRTHGYLPTMG